MLRLKSIGIAVAMLCSLCFVINSHAIEITWMTAAGADDWGDGAYCYAYITTDEGINYVDWSVEDKDGNVVYEYTSLLSGNETNATCYPTLSGDISGADYTIKAVAWHIDENANYLSDNDSYELTIYAPISKSTPDGVQHLLFVDGYVQISKHTYDYASGYMSFDYWATAYHNGEKADGTVDVGTEYKASFPDIAGKENKDWNPNAGEIRGEDGKRSFRDPGSQGITLSGGWQGTEYTGEAYVRLKVGGNNGTDDYLLINTLDCEHN